ncbi:MAG: energy-coupling factor transporter transmembrane component T [bacterium]
MMPSVVLAAAPDRSSSLARLHPATKIAMLLLAVVTCFVVPAYGLPLLLCWLWWSLWRRGLTSRDLASAARPWLLMCGLVLVMHSLIRTETASLGWPSWSGLLRGVIVLGRVIGSAACLALFLRFTPLAELVVGVGWWNRPWRRFGLDSERIGLVLAVALGTVPGVLAEGRRIESVVRLRRGGRSLAGGRFLARPGWWRRIRDHGYVVIPLLEGMFRRVDTLSLALLGRLPRATTPSQRPPVGQLFWLGSWTVCLAVVIWI